MSRVLLLLVLVLLSAPAAAITGNAPSASGLLTRSIVMLFDAREDLCTATAIARDIVLTAAHCVSRKHGYQVKTPLGGGAIAVTTIFVHPRYNPESYLANRATADIAVLKLATPLPDAVIPASLAAAGPVAVGDRLTIAGFGVTTAETARGLGVARMADLSVTGKPGSLQIRLVDPATRNASAGLGGCTGDSGAPAFQNAAVIGVVSWSTGPLDSDGCGGLTGVTPLALYRGWVLDEARKLGAALPP